ncbi:hypothetical protein ACS8E2_00890 [Psychrobacter glaciei]|uniref:hypothetical protein n=1 Tax=Psychrobacter glaciei TaxID=619771 RepID=UPI003F449699
MSSILAATACFAMIGQASAAPAPHFVKHKVSHGQQQKAPQKVVVKKVVVKKVAHKKFVAQNHKHASKVVYVQNRR